MHVRVDQPWQQSLTWRLNHVCFQLAGIGTSACVDLLDLAILDKHCSGLDHFAGSCKDPGATDEKSVIAHQLSPKQLSLVLVILAVSLIAAHHDERREHRQ